MHGTSDAAMVLVFSMYLKTLVYHDYGRGGRVDDKAPEGVNRYEHRTVCGRLTHWHEWRELPDARRSESVAESNISTTFMRLDHARLVGRPCARCWGEHEVLTDGPDRT